MEKEFVMIFGGMMLFMIVLFGGVFWLSNISDQQSLRLQKTCIEQTQNQAYCITRYR